MTTTEESPKKENVIVQNVEHPTSDPPKTDQPPKEENVKPEKLLQPAQELPENSVTNEPLTEKTSIEQDEKKRKSQEFVAAAKDLPTKRRKKHGRNRHQRRDNRKSHYDADYTADDERKNDALEAYYKAQCIVPDGEFRQLMDCLATPLPTSFVVPSSGRLSGTVIEHLKGEVQELFSSIEEAQAPTALPWYPDGMAWTVSVPRQMLRRNNVLSPFQKFLVKMNDVGAINRQEAVSMIPPLMLDVRRGYTVIDMCAAPGSKTAQILDKLAIRPGVRETLTENGLVVANDADIKRCWMLSHQLKRFGSADLVVTNHQAQFFPMLMQFDRVLCDVPCTGDGTLRKAPDIWRRWTSDLGLGIHRLQRQILERGIEILKPGGRLVYSTCSMNPVENEAVVASALRKFGETIELVDVGDMLPELKRRAGLTKWLVKDNSTKVEEDGERKVERPVGWFTKFEQVPPRRQKKIVESLFPPSEEEVSSGKFPLERCVRLVPHDQDTGAFFVAVLVKKETTEEEREEMEKKAARKAEGAQKYMEMGSEEEKVEEKVGKMDRGERTITRLIADDPFTAIEKLNGECLEEVATFFGLDVEQCRTSFMTRGGNAEGFRRVMVVSPTVRKLLKQSIGSGEMDGKMEVKKQLRVVTAGVRVLERTDRKDGLCKFRIIQEGVHIVRGCMKKRVMDVEKEEFVKILEKSNVSIVEFGERFRKELSRCESGSAVIVYGEEMVIVWKGVKSVSLVMPKAALEMLRERFGVNDSNVIGPS